MALNSQELEFPTESSARKVGALHHDHLYMRDTQRHADVLGARP